MREGADQLQQLAEAIRRIEGGSGHAPVHGKGPRVETGAIGQARGSQWPPAAALRHGCVHEWFAWDESARPGPAPSAPPLAVLVDLSARALEADGRRLVWVGRWCWPHPPVLMRGASALRGLWQRSLFVDPPDAGARLWAVEVAVRSTAVSAVVADGRGLCMAGSRRLQLAAQVGRTLVLLARPAAEWKVLSAANTRWQVTPALAPNDRPRWRITRQRCKGVQRWDGTDATRSWLVEWNRAQGLVVASSDVADRANASPARPAWRTA